ncbi:hypothetical protein DFO66_10399 [Brevibacterium sanguinis]|uniref:Uncharacterized protein n=2 Tax=Brevibacterium TaxID=1696 RepID=A0A366IK48_9MICO|nr:MULTISPECIES: hypothetical protein [Brevibacterium]RBP66156.1 hypothetical protein DFO66_10399 [Brevibacterium sanguinis]RBP72807.1 hypothetical protein DFO65_10398 [Brevibacterium celere]
MAIRCYIPTTLSALARGLGPAHAVAPDARGRGLRGEEGEAEEFDALCIAAGLAAAEALSPETAAEGSPRAVLAYDAAETTGHVTLIEGFDLLRLDAVDPARIVSIHVDEPEVWEQAVALAEAEGTEAAEDRLGESDLLWYDVTELPDLLGH